MTATWVVGGSSATLKYELENVTRLEHHHQHADPVTRP